MLILSLGHESELVSAAANLREQGGKQYKLSQAPFDFDSRAPGAEIDYAWRLVWEA